MSNTAPPGPPESAPTGPGNVQGTSGAGSNQQRNNQQAGGAQQRNNAGNVDQYIGERIAPGRGFLTNPLFLRNVFAASAGIEGLFLRNSNLVQGHYITHLEYAAYLHLMSDARAPAKGYTRDCYFIFEGMSPFFPAGKFLPEAEANVIAHELKFHPFVVGAARSVIHDVDALWASVIQGTNLPQGTAIPATPADAVRLATAHGDISTRTLAGIFTTAFNSENNRNLRKRYRMRVAGIISSAVVALSKRATYTERFIETTFAHLSDDLQEAVEPMASDDLKTVFMAVKPHLTRKQDVQDYFNAWIDWMKQEGMPIRMLLICQRAIYSGITCYRVIMQALMDYPNFSWDIIERLFPVDMANFYAAYTAVADGAYCGFIDDANRLTKNAKFKDLAWVSARLLEKANPREYGMLKKYAALKGQHIVREEEIISLIDHYVGQIHGEVREPENFVNYEEPNYLRFRAARAEELRALQEAAGQALAAAAE